MIINNDNFKAVREGIGLENRLYALCEKVFYIITDDDDAEVQNGLIGNFYRCSCQDGTS